MWDQHHHVCENYPSTIDFAAGQSPSNTSCTGNDFYMWGGLSGFIGMVEEGHYE